MSSHICARLGAPLRSILLAAACSTLLASAAAAEDLDLSAALRRAAAQDAGAPGAEARVRAAEAGWRQARVRPNPSVGVELENFAGTGGVGVGESAETTIYYEQRFERGGKREARGEVARAEIEVVRQRGTIRALDLMAEVQLVWVDAQAAEAQVALAEYRLAVAERIERDVARRVAAARDPLFAGERARTAVAQARIALDQARDAARAGRAQLALYWGGSADFTLDNRPFLTLVESAPPPLADGNPDLALIAAQRAVATARIAVERSRAVQDVTVRGGLRHFGASNDVALVAGASIPLGQYDTNRGAIDQAQAERTAHDRDLIAARMEREREIARLVTRRAAAVSEIRRIEREVIPSAEEAVRLVRDGFNRGGGAFNYLEVAEAERALIDAQGRKIDLFRAFHADGARLDRLLAVHLPLIAAQESR